MMNDAINVTLTRAAAVAFMTIAESVSDRFSAAGCNDLELPDTPENRELMDMLGAENVRMTVAEWRASKDYEKPRPQGGKLYFMDHAVFGHLVDRVQGALARPAREHQEAKS